MATYIPEGLRSLTALEDLSGKAGHAIKFGDTGGDPAKGARIATTGAGFIGVLLYDGSSSPGGVVGQAKGRTVTVQTLGTAKVVTAGAISMSTTNGAVAPTTGGKFKQAVTGDLVVGYAEEAASGADQIISVRLIGRAAAMP